MSGRAASRECRNAGNRPASWNGRTGLGERGLLVATAGAPRWHPKSVGCTPRKDRDLSAIAAGPLAITSMGENVRTSEISD